MKKKKITKIIFATLLTMYILLAIIFAIQIFHLSKVYTQIEQQRIMDVQFELDKVLHDAKPNELKEKLDELVQKYPVELIISQDNKTIYTTFESVTINSIRNILHDKAILYKAQTPLITEQGTYFVIYGVYHVSMVEFIEGEFRVLTLFLFLLIFIIVVILTFLSYILLKPLQDIRKALSQTEHYKYGKILQEDHAIAQDLNHFKQKIDDKLMNVSHNYTDLEIALQFERERLSIMMMLTRAYIHDLKSPIHQILLENDFTRQKLAKKNQIAHAITDYNVEKTDKVLQQINEILVLMDTDVDSLAFATEKFDFIAVCDETWNLFKVTAKKNNIGFFSDIPEKLIVEMNKVTAKILIHNILSNATKYAVPYSEIIFEIDDSDKEYFIVKCMNEATKEDIERMRASEELFNVIDIEHGYSSGNGLYLLKELSEYVHGKYSLLVEQDSVTIELELPKMMLGSDENEA